MTAQEYLDNAFEAYNTGRIDVETYDAMLMQMDEFVEE